MFPFLTIFIILLIAMAIRFRQLDKKQEAKEEAFWSRELEASATLAKDISNLPYITIPLDKFPLNFSEDEDILSIEQELSELSTHKLLNLTGKTNTDLKLEYGVPNFETMKQIGDDYDRVTVLLNTYGKVLMANERFDDAIRVLEFAVGTNTDVSETYVLLAACYFATGKDDKLLYLKEHVEKMDTLMKASILAHIEEITNPPEQDSTDTDETADTADTEDF